jgi:hypothetical protein
MHMNKQDTYLHYVDSHFSDLLCSHNIMIDIDVTLIPIFSCCYIHKWRKWEDEAFRDNHESFSPKCILLTLQNKLHKFNWKFILCNEVKQKWKAFENDIS